MPQCGERRNKMNDNPISELVNNALQNIREMVDVNTIIGSPIETGHGVTIIPVSSTWNFSWNYMS